VVWSGELRRRELIEPSERIGAQNARFEEWLPEMQKPHQRDVLNAAGGETE
jgi:hypothetical protein